MVKGGKVLLLLAMFPTSYARDTKPILALYHLLHSHRLPQHSLLNNNNHPSRYYSVTKKPNSLRHHQYPLFLLPLLLHHLQTLSLLHSRINPDVLRTILDLSLTNYMNTTRFMTTTQSSVWLIVGLSVSNNNDKKITRALSILRMLA